MELTACLERLCRANGVGGCPQAGEAAGEYLKELGCEVRIDRLGNVIGIRRCGKPEAPLLLLEAHIDEIGFVVTRVDDDGFLQVAPCGGVDNRTLAAAEVVVYADKPLAGVFGSTPPHLADQQEKTLPPITQRGIDVGLTKQQLAERVPAGTRVGFAPHFDRLENGRVCSKALDNRASVAAVLYALSLLREEVLERDVAAVFNVQEELGGYGAMVSTYALDPREAIAVDVSFGYTPDADRAACGELGRGAMIGISPCLDRGISGALLRLAKEKDIPFQTEVVGGVTGTDADRMATVRCGVPMGLVSVPLRYMHTPVEVADIEDIRAVGRLLAAYVQAGGKPVC